MGCPATTMRNKPIEGAQRFAYVHNHPSANRHTKIRKMALNNEYPHTPLGTEILVTQYFIVEAHLGHRADLAKALGLADRHRGHLHQVIIATLKFA